MRDSTPLSVAAVGPVELSPRLRETLTGLLKGMSEKQLAKNLGLSKNTVHAYVKALYKQFCVNSRSELLSLWIPPVRMIEEEQPVDSSEVELPALASLRAERVRLSRELARLDQQIAARLDSTRRTPAVHQILVTTGGSAGYEMIANLQNTV